VANLYVMGSRLLPLALALGALAADGLGLHGVASYAVLAAVFGAAAASFVAVARLLEGEGSVSCACTTTLSLVLLVLGSAVRAVAPVGGHVPTLAISTLVLAVVVYALPLLPWVLEPLLLRPRAARLRPAPFR
jgi:hypothetical protein